MKDKLKVHVMREYSFTCMKYRYYLYINDKFTCAYDTIEDAKKVMDEIFDKAKTINAPEIVLESTIEL